MLLALVLVLVLAKNMLDSKYVRQLGTSFAAVYEDRLLVESYIFQLSGHLYQKKMTVDNYYQVKDYALLQDKLTSSNAAISTLLQDYEKTQLTQDESRHFSALKQNMAAIQALETGFLTKAAAGQETPGGQRQMDAQYTLASGHLNQLSHIQVAEGKRLSEQSKQIVAGSTILTQFELVLIICIGVMILMLVFASKSKISKFPQKPMLN